MDEAWAAVVAATAAGVFGLGGAYIGLVAGRRQAADQARVEHGHWLRGQRQEAYVQFLDAWDRTIRDLQQFRSGWDNVVREAREHGELSELSEMAVQKANEAWTAVYSVLVRAAMLGPKKVDQAALPLDLLFRDLVRELMEQGRRDVSLVDWGRWDELLAKATEARGRFHYEAMQALRMPPSPKGERLH
ncbi:hypothetical protein ACIP10_17615 [Streptomyces galbus]|uniref:hypothetical protein n=1 Tax=Streptomyces galbus TaxID=33898 RepID=UPI0037B78C45